MKLSALEVRQMKQSYQYMIEHPVNRLQQVLAQYWLRRLQRLGVFAMRDLP